jgi:hypothetical protein
LNNQLPKEKQKTQRFDMKMLLLFLPLAATLLSGCDVPIAMERNKQAIQRSTCAIQRNAYAVERVTENLDQVTENLDKVTANLEQMQEE